MNKNNIIFLLILCLLCASCTNDEAIDKYKNWIINPARYDSGFEHAVITVENAEISDSREILITGKIQNPTDKIMFVPMAYRGYESCSAPSCDDFLGAILEDMWFGNLRYSENPTCNEWKAFRFFARVHPYERYYPISRKGIVKFKYTIKLDGLRLTEKDIARFSSSSFKLYDRGVESNVFTFERVEFFSREPKDKNAFYARDSAREIPPYTES